MSAPNPLQGGQGLVHGAIVADPVNPNVVFIGGDFGPVFRGTAVGNVWEDVTGANAGTVPHPDFRAMVFDPSGNILAAQDGGIAKLSNPNTPATRVWTSLVGNIGSAEMNYTAYDPLGNVVFGGLQDLGAAFQSSPSNRTWNIILGADGGSVAIDSDQIAHPGTSFRYTVIYYMIAFTRSTFDAANNLIGNQGVGLNITSGGGAGQNLLDFDGSRGFYTVYALNKIDPSRMLIGTANIYESLDKGDTLANLGSTLYGAGIVSMAYGGRLGGVDKPDVFYTSSAYCFQHRVNAGDPITELPYPGYAAAALVIDPQNYQHVYALDGDSDHVLASFDEGASWTDLTGNLLTLSPGVRTLEFVNPNTATDNTVLLAGGAGGVFQLKQPATAANPTWSALPGAKLPHAIVRNLHYDYTDNVLVAGTLGRGVWTLTGAFPAVAATSPVAARTAQPVDPAAAIFNPLTPEQMQQRREYRPVVAPPADYPQR